MIHETLAELLRLLGSSKCDFAKQIGFSPAYITLLLNGTKKNPSDRFYHAVCSTYAVNEAWLRTGCGAVFLDETTQARIDDTALLKKYKRLSPLHQAFINDLINTMILKSQQENNELPPKNKINK